MEGVLFVWQSKTKKKQIVCVASDLNGSARTTLSRQFKQDATAAGIYHNTKLMHISVLKYICSVITNFIYFIV